jgi:hypothetical protein
MSFQDVKIWLDLAGKLAVRPKFSYNTAISFSGENRFFNKNQRKQKLS